MTRNHETPGSKKAALSKAMDPGVTVKISRHAKTLLDAAIPHCPARRGQTVKAVVSDLSAAWATATLKRHGVPAPVV